MKVLAGPAEVRGKEDTWVLVSVGVVEKKKTSEVLGQTVGHPNWRLRERPQLSTTVTGATEETRWSLG